MILNFCAQFIIYVQFFLRDFFVKTEENGRNRAFLCPVLTVSYSITYHSLCGFRVVKIKIYAAFLLYKSAKSNSVGIIKNSRLTCGYDPCFFLKKHLYPATTEVRNTAQKRLCLVSQSYLILTVGFDIF